MPGVPPSTIPTAGVSAGRPPLPPEALQRMARQCARRLRYAHFKVQNGWAQQTIDEVETLCTKRRTEPVQGDVFGPYASIASGPKAVLRRRSSHSKPYASSPHSTSILGPNQQSRALFGRPAPLTSTSKATSTSAARTADKHSYHPPALASPLPLGPITSTPAARGTKMLRTPSRGLDEGRTTPYSPSQGVCLAPPWSGPRGAGSTPLGDTTNYSTFWSQVAALHSTPSLKRPARTVHAPGSENIEQPPIKRRAMGL